MCVRSELVHQIYSQEVWDMLQTAPIKAPLPYCNSIFILPVSRANFPGETIYSPCRTLHAFPACNADAAFKDAAAIVPP